jgi:hypothetical protein
MPKKIVSLSGIVKAIDKVESQLVSAENKAVTTHEKRKLATKIRKLKKIKGLVARNCPKGKTGLSFAVPA